MGRRSFEAWGGLAGTLLSARLRAGRFTAQAADERRIPSDVVRKLALTPSDTLLEIGCGPGRLLRPLSKRVREITGIDHPATIARLATELKGLTLIGGNFLDLQLKRRFTKVLVYAVI